MIETEEARELLRSLRIDRSVPSVRPARAISWPRYAAGGAALLLIASAGWLWAHRTPIVEVEVTRPISEQVSPAATSASLDASGYVLARRQATVSANVTGRLKHLFIEEGEHVNAGQALAQLDPTNANDEVRQAEAAVAQGEAELRQAETALGDGQPAFDRKVQLHSQGFISTDAVEAGGAALDQLKSALLVTRRHLELQRTALQIARQGLDDTTVRAPFAGVITSKNAQPGEIISPLSAGGGFTRTGIGTLVDMDSLEVDVDVSENFISRIDVGDNAVLQLNAYPDWRIPAYLIAVIPTADRGKATVRVRVGFKTRDPRILPEMGAHVTFLKRRSDAESDIGGAAPGRSVAVPVSSVSTSGGERAGGTQRGVVFLVRSDQLVRQEVVLGARQGDRQTVLSGLGACDLVVVDQRSDLRDGIRVRAKPTPNAASGPCT